MKFTDLKKERVFKLPAHYPSLTQKERAKVRTQYMKEQEGLCHYCKEPLSGMPSQFVMERYKLNLTLFPKGFLAHPVHLHHDHGTGLTIGAVHSYCNGVLWEYHGE